MKVCILGGGNVYALNFARYLATNGIDHFGIGRTGPKATAFWQVGHDYKFYQLHLINDFHFVMTAIGVERPDIVVNFAAQGEGAASFGADSHLFYATNSTAMVRVAEAFRQWGRLHRFIQISTSELYGSTEEPAREYSPLRPSSPYAISKAAFDQHLGVMFKAHGFPMNIIRPSNCYCPGQQLHRVIPRAVIAALGGPRMRLEGGGAAIKSYLHADDLSEAIFRVIPLGAPGEIYNCGPDEPVSIRRLVENVALICGVALTEMADEAPARKVEDARYWLDSSKLHQDTGWTPNINLQDGLKGMVQWVKNHPEIMAADATYRIAE